MRNERNTARYGRDAPYSDRQQRRARTKRAGKGFLFFITFILTLWTCVLVLYSVYLAESRTPAPTWDSRQLRASAHLPEDVEARNPFAAFSFYNADFQPQYEEYHEIRPYLDYEDVVWKVNAGLNRPFFTAAELNTDATPLLVNPFNRLPNDFVPRELVTIDAAGRTATPETVAAFRLMSDDARRDGFHLVITSAYRGFELQAELFENAGGLTELPLSTAPPGFSEHHTGRALDLAGEDGSLLDRSAPSEMGRWVAENAHLYGFIVRYTSENSHITGYINEPWHITYVTTDISMAMRSGGYESLEEYIAKNPDARL